MYCICPQYYAIGDRWETCRRRLLLCHKKINYCGGFFPILVVLFYSSECVCISFFADIEQFLFAAIALNYVARFSFAVNRKIAWYGCLFGVFSMQIMKFSYSKWNSNNLFSLRGNGARRLRKSVQNLSRSSAFIRTVNWDTINCILRKKIYVFYSTFYSVYYFWINE